MKPYLKESPSANTTLHPCRKTPHYLCLYSEKKDGYLMNAGFMLQQIDLSLSANGYGSCWIGLGKPAGSPPEAKGLDYIIMLAFGKAAEPVYRANTTEFIRKSLPEITQIAGAEQLLEPVQLAPSASNMRAGLNILSLWGRSAPAPPLRPGAGNAAYARHTAPRAYPSVWN